jgi:hypothetical protein
VRRLFSFAVAALLSAAAVWLSVWQGELSRDALGAHRSVEVVGAAAVVAVFVLGWSRQHRTTRDWSAATVRLTWGWRDEPRERRISLLAWCAVASGVIGWDLFSFAIQSASYPTLSTLVGHVTRYPVGRGLLFGLWLVVGAYAVAGWRAPSRR